MRDRDSVVRRLVDGGVVAIIRTASAEPLLDIVRAVVAGGITSVEVTMTTPGAVAGIGRLAEALGDSVLLGVGTVLDSKACREAVNAGAQFVVSPGFDEAVHATVKEMEKVSIPGAMTPTEILRAWTAGADLVKVFPSGPLGPGFLREVMAPLPHVKLMPTGGIDAANVGEWFKAGAVCVGAGAALVTKESVAKRDWGAITERARTFARAVANARNQNAATS